MAVKPTTSTNDLAELVTCSICFENFKDARALPCMHSYCKKCLEDLIGREGKITCPHCRREFEVPDGDVSNLSPNFIVNDMVDALHSISDTVPSSNEASTSIILSTSTVAANKPANPTKCEDHPEKEYELFCQTCSKLICYKCISNWGACGQHRYESIDTVSKTYQNAVNNFLKKRVELLPSFVKHAVILTKMKEEQSDNVHEVTKQISHTFAKHIEDMKVRETMLMTQAFEMQKKNEEDLSSELDRVQLEQAKIENTIEFCHKILELNDPVQFLEMYIQAKDKAFQDVPQDLISHVDTTNLCFQATDALLTDVISNFGNVVVFDESIVAAEEKLARAEKPPSNFRKKPLNSAKNPALASGSGHGATPLVPNAGNEPEPTAPPKPVIWKFSNKCLSSPYVMFEDNGFSVKTTSSKNEAIIGRPGFKEGKHTWKIKITGFPNGLGIGICVGPNGPGIVVTYDSGLTFSRTSLNVLVELDCEAQRVQVLPENCVTPEVITFINPHNKEIYPYFYLSPARPNMNNVNKITIISIDGFSQENSDACCIL